MKILIASERFVPSVGGVQTVTRLLGQALARAGHKITLITREPGQATSDPNSFHLIRRPGPFSVLKLCAATDAMILQGSVLRLAWPLLLKPRPTLMVHHLVPATPDSGLARSLRAKLNSRVCHATVSQAMARQLGSAVQAVVPNPYDDAVFRLDPSVPRTHDLIFVGRLIPEKGARVLIEALGILQGSGATTSATIVGTGSESEPLAALVAARGLHCSVVFPGQVIGLALARLLNQHRLLIVPSVHDESFGLVALEGIASGCVVVASDAGGLPEAVGTCGTIFPQGDAAHLASTLRILLAPDGSIPFRVNAAAHLAPYRPEAVAQRYLEVIRGLRFSRGDRTCL